MALLLFQPDVKELLKNPPPSKSKSKNKRKFYPDKPGRINFESLSPFQKDGVWVTRGRYGSEMGRILGSSELPILPSTCPLAKTIMVSAHNQAHRGASDTCFRSRTRAWITRGRTLAEKVCRECPRCPFLWKSHMGQQMGNLPPERLHIGEKPWTAICLDLFGPYLVKPVAQSRCRTKVWPVVIGCLSTGATHVELMDNYGADTFLKAFADFASFRGYPDQVYTDRGTQLSRASENIAEKSENWDWKKIESATAHKKTQWRFCPAASPWRNGMAQSRVKAFKESLDNLMPAGLDNLSYSEFYTLLKLCCNIINDRPLGVKRASDGVNGDHANHSKYAFTWKIFHRAS